VGTERGVSVLAITLLIVTTLIVASAGVGFTTAKLGLGKSALSSSSVAGSAELEPVSYKETLSSTIIFRDNFDNATDSDAQYDNWTGGCDTGGSGWKKLSSNSGGPKQGAGRLGLLESGSALKPWIHTPSFSTTNYTDIRISFGWALELNGDRKDTFEAQWSTDASTWTTIAGTSYCPDTEGSSKTIDNLSVGTDDEVGNKANLYIRWKHTLDSGSNYRDKVSFDNVVIDGTPGTIIPTVHVIISPENIWNIRGTINNYNVKIQNNDNQGHTFDLENTDTENWSMSIPSPVHVNSGSENNVTLTVTIPDNASISTVDTITVTATAQDNENFENSGTCQAIVVRPGHLVISEFATRGSSSAYDEFIELYNPALGVAIPIAGWKLEYYTGYYPPSPPTWNEIVTLPSGASIPENGFYLWASSTGYVSPGSGPTPDYATAFSGIADGNNGPRGVRLKNDLGTVVDTVVYENDGNTSSTVAEGELTAPAPNYSSNTASTERKARRTSTSDSMGPGGADENYGPARDTNNNYDDFVRLVTRDPDNTSSPCRPPAPPDNLVIVTISPERGCGIPEDNLSFDVDVYFSHTVYTSRTFNLTSSNNRGWPGITFTPNQLTINSDDTGSAVMTVPIQENEIFGAVNTITVTATDSGDNSFENSDTCQATVSRWMYDSSIPVVQGYGVSVTGAGDYIYIANSATGYGTNKFMRYNTVSKWWENLDVPSDDFRNGVCGAWDGGDYIYYLFGSSYGAVGLKNFWRYNILHGTWEKLPDTQGEQGAGDGIAYSHYDNKVYAITGRTAPAPENTRLAVFARYNPATEEWDNTLPEPWDNTDDGAALVAVGENIYATQGEIYENSSYGPDIYSFKYFSIPDNRWYDARNFPKAESDGTSLAYDGENYIYALGGNPTSEPEAVGDNFFRYSIPDNNWEELCHIPTAVGINNGARLAYSNGDMWYWPGRTDSSYGITAEEKPKVWRYPLDNYFVAVNVFPSPYPGVFSLSNAGASEAQPGLKNNTLQYVVNVRNMGLVTSRANSSDNYDLTPVDSAGSNWPMSLDENHFTNVGPGVRVSANLTVTVPIPARDGDVDNITVNAAGKGNSDSDNTQARKVSMSQSPLADAYTNQYAPNNNYGTNQNIYVGMYGDNAERGYFKFDLSGIQSNVTEITSAQLWVWCWATDNSPTIEAWSVENDNWIESGAGGITWNNQPAGIDTLDSVHVPMYVKNTWLVFDVTSFVNDEYLGDKIASILLKLDVETQGIHPNTSVRLDSKEYGSHAPMLVIVYKRPVDVDISPDSIRVPLETTYSFDVTIINECDNEYTFDLENSDNLGWPLELSENTVILGPDNYAVVQLQVTVPDNAQLGTTDNIIVTATAQENENATGYDICYVTPSQWFMEPSTAEVRDYGVSVAGAGNYIYIANSGISNGTNKFWRYNTVSKEWENMDNTSYYSNAVGYFRNGVCGAWDGGDYIYYLFGASYSENKYDFFRYKISTGSWEKLLDTPGCQGAGNGIVFGPYDENVYVMTGRTDHNNSANTRLCVFARYSPVTNTWDNTLLEPWDKCDDGASLVAVENYIYATQGELYGESGADVKTFERYNIATGSWATLENFPKGERDTASLAYPGSGNYIYALGGQETDGSSVGVPGYRYYRYSISGNSWENLEDIPVAVYDQNGQRLAYSNGDMWYWSGVADLGEDAKKLWRYPLSDYAVGVDVYTGKYPEAVGITHEGFYYDGMPQMGGYTEDYSIRVRNMGLVTDNYDLENNDTLGWGLHLSRTRLTDVPMGYYIELELNVTTPILDSVGGDVDQITVTATGSGGSTGSDSIRERKINADPIPTNDTYVTSLNDGPHGAETHIYVGYYTPATEAQRGFFKFDLENYGIPSNAYDIVDAQLWVYQYDSWNVPTIELWSVDNDVWNETTLQNWPGPALVTKLDDLVMQMGTKYRWLIFGGGLTTEFVENQFNGDKTLSLGLKEKLESGPSVSIDSKEYGDYEPMLVVIYKKKVSIDIDPDQSSGRPGSTVVYTAQIWNNDNAQHIYNLTKADNKGWNIVLENTSLTIPAGGSATTHVNVDIPAGASRFENDNIYVTVVRQDLTTENDTEGIDAYATGVKPTDDVTISQEYADTNFNGETYLRVTRALNKNYRSLLKFDVENNTVENAKLVLYCYTDNGSVPVDVYTTSTAWDEDTMTWDNMPSLGAYVNTFTPVSGVNEVDVTSAVVSGTPVAFVLKAENENLSTWDNYYFDSKDYYYAPDQPFLEITYAAAGWPYSRPIKIIGSHPENYQLKVVIPYENENMRPDYGDLRFFENENVGELSYWIENYTADNATVWVRRVENSDSTIYMYYGNPSATSTSDGHATFIGFSNFEDGALDGWENISFTLMQSSTGTALVGSSSLKGYKTTGYRVPADAYKSVPLPSTYIVDVGIRYGSTASSNDFFFGVYYSGTASGSWANGVRMYLNAGKMRYKLGTATSVDTGKTYIVNTWYRARIVRTGTSTWNLYYFNADGTTIWEGTNLSYSPASAPDRLLLQIDQTSTAVGYIDRVLVRKYVYPEPTTTFDSTPPEVPELIAPGDGENTPDATPTFAWTSVSDPSGVTYHIQVDNDPDFSSPEVNVTGLIDNTYTSPKLANENYSWRVRAVDGAGNVSDWSSVWTFLIDTGEWTRSRSIKIIGSHPENYQLKVIIPYDSDMQPDYDDLRFFENENVGELSYWIENYTAAQAIVWVRRLDNSPSDDTIYVHYGNPIVPSESDMYATFIRVIDGAQPVKLSLSMDEGTGTTTKDNSGNGNNGTLVNGPTWVDSRFGKALSFDGVNDYVGVANSSSLNPTSAITMEAWIKLSALNASKRIIRKASQWLLWFNASKQLEAIVVVGGSNVTATYTTLLSTGTWYHVVAKYDPTTTRVHLFLNGSEVATSSTKTGSIATTTNPLGIGAAYGGTEALQGTIDEVRIYNRALSAVEISALYGNYGYVTPNYPGRNLVREWVWPEPRTTLDATPPTSSVNPILPYWRNRVPFTVVATASDDMTGVSSVELFYRYSSDNTVWGLWKSLGVDTTSPWSWSFTASDDNGYYEFYSIAIDVAGNQENAPAVADAMCGVARDDWWNYDWTRSRPITITGSYPENCQLKVVIPYASDMRSDYGDLRFLENKVSGKLNYWVENYTAAQAIVWVRRLENSDNTIYVYYGNSNATSESDPSATFIRVIDNVRGNWGMDENAGTTTKDNSGYNNNGTLLPAGSEPTWTGGKFSSALNFDGTNDRVNCGNDNSLFVTPVSVEAWVKPAGDNIPTGARRPIVTKSSTNDKTGWHLDLADDGNVEGYRFVVKTTVAKWSTTISTAWTHMVGTYDGTNIRLYVDNVLRASAVWTASITDNANVLIGSRQLATVYYFKGIIDEVRIYNRTLDNDDISALYSNYSYVTPNYPSKALVRKWISPEPTASVGNEENVPEWWSPDWTRSRPITITGSHPENCQLKVVIPYDSDMRSDYGDLRFLENKVSGKLNYWVENYTADNATVWVRRLENSDNTIYVYYGNSNATSESDPSATFIRVIDNVRGNWGMDENAGTTTKDNSGYNNNGTLLPAGSEPTWTGGKFSSALNFDGTNDRVNCGNDNSLFVTPVSVEAWVKPAGDNIPTGARRPIVTKSSTNDKTGWHLDLADDGNVEGYRFVVKTTVAKWSTTISTAWTHMVGTYDGTNIRLYVDNVLRASAVWTASITDNANVLIGSRQLATVYYFKGAIDEVRVYNRTLDNADISALYNNYGYVTPNYPGKVLVRKLVSPEPTISIGDEEI